jgi:hypothetical protein
MIYQIYQIVRNSINELEIAQPLPEKPVFIVQTRHRIIISFFSGDARETPLLFVKIHRDPEDFPRVENTVQQVKMLRGMVSDSLRATIPPIKFLDALHGMAVTAQKGLPGYPLEISSASSKNLKVLEQRSSNFSNWLFNLNQYTNTGDFTIHKSWLEERINNLNALSTEVRQKLVDSTSSLFGLQIPRGWICGDTHPTNILFAKDTSVCGFVDWEGIQENNLVIYDWFQFVVSLAYEYIKQGKHSKTILERMVSACKILYHEPHSALAKMLRNQSILYLQRLEIHESLLKPLFLLFLVDYYWFENKEELFLQIL